MLKTRNAADALKKDVVENNFEPSTFAKMRLGTSPKDTWRIACEANTLRTYTTHRLPEIANAVEVGRTGASTSKINGPFLFKEGGTSAEYGAALDYAIAKG
jgi:hypothetical protein